MKPLLQSYQDPSPPLPLVDEPCKEWREEATSDEEKSIDRYVCPPLMCKILEESDYVDENLFAKGHAISVTDISHRDSTGAPKKPCKSLLAIHCPLVFVKGTHIIIAYNKASVAKTKATKLASDSQLLLASRLDTQAAFHIAVREVARTSSPSQTVRTASVQHRVGTGTEISNHITRPCV